MATHVRRRILNPAVVLRSWKKGYKSPAPHVRHVTRYIPSAIAVHCLGVDARAAQDWREWYYNLARTRARVRPL
jgi:hypothetical protein